MTASRPPPARTSASPGPECLAPPVQKARDTSAASSRSKSDTDLAEWLPTAHSYHCTYTAIWAATTLRWDLAADTAGGHALLVPAEVCPSTTVVYHPAS